MNFTEIAYARQSCRNYNTTRSVEPEKIGAILESGNRTAAGPTVPPGGLYMSHLWYDDGVEKFECTPWQD